MGLEVQALPSFAQLAGSPDQLVEQLRPITPSRFLGRAPLDAELPGGSETYVGPPCPGLGRAAGRSGPSCAAS